jgi:hypothetical protein
MSLVSGPSRDAGAILSEPMRSGRDPPDDRLTGLGALSTLTRCRIPDLVGLAPAVPRS